MAIFYSGPLQAYAYEAIAVDDTVGGKAFTAATYDLVLTANGVTTPRRPKEAVVTVEDQNLRWTVDGTAPTTAVGHLAQPYDTIVIDGYENIKKFRAIRSTGSSSAIKVTYYRHD